MNTGASKLSVLLVENEKDWYDNYCDILKEYGEAVVCVWAQNYSQAKLELERRTFDIAIVDLGLSDDKQQETYQGIQLIQELSALLFPPIVIVSTGYRDKAEKDPEFPTDFVLGLYEKFTDPVSTLREMIETARKLKRVQRLLVLASKYTSGTTPITKELKKILWQFVKLTKSSVCHLLLPTEDKKHLEIVVDTGGDEGRRVEIDDSLTGDVFKTRSLINCGDTSKHPRYKPVSGKILMKSELAVPLLEDSRAIGVLNIEGESLNAFTTEHQELMTTFADFVVATLQNDRRRQDLQDLVGRTTSQLVESVVDLDKVFNTILDRGLKLINASTGLVALVEPNNQLKIVATTPGAKSPKGTILEVSDSVCGLAVQRGYAINVPDVTREPYVRYFRVVFGEGIHSELVVPLRLENKVIGVLNFESPEPSAFTSEDLRLLVALASQATVAIRITKELEQRARQMREVERITTLSDLIGGLTHNVRSPTIGILVDVSQIRSQYANVLNSNSKLREYLDRIEQAANKIKEIPSWVVEKTKVYMPSMPMTGKEFVISRVQHMREKGEIPPEVSIIIDEAVRDTPPFLAYEHTPLVIENLVVNSIQAMEGKGTIKIGAQTDSKSYVEIWVEDTGRGIPRERQELIFDRDFSTRKEGGGIGLWWAKTHLEKLGASIWVENLLTNKGARFVIHFPMYILAW